MKVLITGSNGFIGKNLKLFLQEKKEIEIISFSKKNHINDLNELVNKSNFIFHLLGVNRSNDQDEFNYGNEKITKELCEAVKKANRKIPIVFTSSTQVKLKSSYGISKINAENTLIELSKKFKIPIFIYRLPNIFGKWSKPNYNSVVATFCHNIIRNIPINIHDPLSKIKLVYIDDLIKNFILLLDNANKELIPDIYFRSVKPEYEITVGNLAKQIIMFKEMRSTHILERVGSGFKRALYSTYVSFLPKDKFSYPVVAHKDNRGSFVEMLKTPDCGQFSVFTVSPNMTRGEHYHNTKTEKFLVIKGNASFLHSKYY